MSVTINAQKSTQVTNPTIRRFPIGNYIINCTNNCFYSVNGGSTWYQLKSNVQAEVKSTQLMIAENLGSGTVTVEEVPLNTELINS